MQVQLINFFESLHQLCYQMQNDINRLETTFYNKAQNKKRKILS